MLAEQAYDLVGADLAPDRATLALEPTFSGWGLRNATNRELTELREQTTTSFDAGADPYLLAGRGDEIPVGSTAV